MSIVFVKAEGFEEGEAVEIDGFHLTEEELESFVKENPRIKRMFLSSVNKPFFFHHLRALPQLRELSCDLSFTPLETLLALCTLKRLRTLEIALADHLSSTFFQELLALTQLECLSLDSSDKVSAEDFKTLAQMKKLHALSLTKYTFSEEELSALCSIGKLTSLHLSYCRMTDHLLKSLLPLSGQLEKLSLTETEERITDKGLKIVGAFQNLKKLHIDVDSNLTAQGFSQLKNLFSLEDLSLRTMHLDDKTVNMIATFSHLTRLCLQVLDGQVSAKGWHSLEALIHLREVTLRGYLGGARDAMIHFLSSLKKLERWSTDQMIDEYIANSRRH